MLMNQKPKIANVSTKAIIDVLSFKDGGITAAYMDPELFVLVH